METGAITGYMDVAQIALYVFWLFFAGLIFYLRREDKREGYPLVTEREGHVLQGFPVMPAPKTFLLQNGNKILAPRVDGREEPTFNAQPLAMWPGAPMQPLGNPMTAGAGPAASTLRVDEPEMLQELEECRIAPLRVATDHFLDEECPDPRGKEVVGADGIVGGVVSDVWIDRAETAIRYLEVTLAAGATVLVPMPLSKVQDSGRVILHSVLGSQLADAPTLAHPDRITLREEDRVSSYFASGHLYAKPGRGEPLL